MEPRSRSTCVPCFLPGCLACRALPAGHLYEAGGSCPRRPGARPSSGAPSLSSEEGLCPQGPPRSCWSLSVTCAWTAPVSVLPSSRGPGLPGAERVGSKQGPPGGNRQGPGSQASQSWVPWLGSRALGRETAPHLGLVAVRAPFASLLRMHGRDAEPVCPPSCGA